MWPWAASRNKVLDLSPHHETGITGSTPPSCGCRYPHLYRLPDAGSLISNSHMRVTERVTNTTVSGQRPPPHPVAAGHSHAAAPLPYPAMGT
eukprot:3267679-Amphidinium_carterae.2